MRVFIAGAFGDHNPPSVIAENIAKADKVARALMALGHQVFVPHKITWGWGLTRAQAQALDRTFLKHWAEAIYRIPGDSPGADAEMAYARELGLIELEAGL